MGLVGSLGDIIRRALLDQGRVSRREIYKRSRKQREKNRARQRRRDTRVITRAMRP